MRLLIAGLGLLLSACGGAPDSTNEPEKDAQQFMTNPADLENKVYTISDAEGSHRIMAEGYAERLCERASGQLAQGPEQKWNTRAFYKGQGQWNVLLSIKLYQTTMLDNGACVADTEKGTATMTSALR